MDFITAKHMNEIANKKNEEMAKQKEIKAQEEVKNIIDNLILPKAQNGEYGTCVTLPSGVDFLDVKRILTKQGYKTEWYYKNRHLIIMW